MAPSNSALGKTGESASPLRLCGNCAHACFNLKKQERDLLFKILRRYKRGTIQKWLKEGRTTILAKRNKVDIEKTRFMQLIRETACLCKVAGATVDATELGCHLWLPRENFNFIAPAGL